MIAAGRIGAAADSCRGRGRGEVFVEGPVPISSACIHPSNVARGAGPNHIAIESAACPSGFLIVYLFNAAQARPRSLANGVCFFTEGGWHTALAEPRGVGADSVGVPVDKGKVGAGLG